MYCIACGHGIRRAVSHDCTAPLKLRIAELEDALKQIANGLIDEGGARRDHPDAAAIARDALTQ